jgi:hypothetical protein
VIETPLNLGHLGFDLTALLVFDATLPGVDAIDLDP